MKLIIIVCASLILSGCDDHPDGWEFQTYVEIGTGVEQLLEKEKALRASGYKRVRITEAHRLATEALSAPARNCDVYTHDEALEVWEAEKENERNGCFDEWLYHVAAEEGAGT